MANATRRPVLIGLFALLAAGPAFARSPGPQFSPATISKAGHALNEVMAINRTYAGQLQHATDPASRQQILAADKTKGAEAVNRNGLTVDQYNQILETARQDPTLRQKLVTAATEQSD